MIRIKRAAARPMVKLLREALDGNQLTANVLAGVPRDTIIREFEDPLLEAIRLLREATEIEHSLMVQYLFAAYSVSPLYADLLKGAAQPGADSLIGVAIQEMQHLGMVNELLKDLGQAPNLIRQDFPYEPDIYPFPLHLERLSLKSAAKYLYTEAPAAALDRDAPENAGEAEQAFLTKLFEVIGTETRPNHLGSLYGALLSVLQEADSAAPGSIPNLPDHLSRLEFVRGEGEKDHFLFFKAVFLGKHEAFPQERNVWDLADTDPNYPSLPFPANPSAFEGHENQIPGETVCLIGALANFHYWVILMLLDLHYRSTNLDAKRIYISLSRKHMVQPLASLGETLATMNTGLPFDVLSLGYAPGQDLRNSVEFVMRLLTEAVGRAEKLRAHLPTFPFNTASASLQKLRELLAAGTI
jgi:hypothetical protein